MLVYTMVYSGPSWFVNLPATKKNVAIHCVSNYSGENHSVNPTFLDLKNVRPNKEKSSYLAILVGF